MSISASGADYSWDLSLNSSITSALPEGDKQFRTPPGIAANGAGYSWKLDIGVSARGDVSAGGSIVDYQAELKYGGESVKSVSPTGYLYYVSAVPLGVSSGDAVEDTDATLRIVTGGGGLKTFTGITAPSVKHATFTSLDVTVKDAAGNAVEGDNVSIGSAGLTTNSNGVAKGQAAGTVTVKALRGSASKDVDTSATSAVTFQYAGFDVGAKGPTGSPLRNAQVRFEKDDGTVIETATTDDSGTARLTQLPPKTSGKLVVGNAIERNVTTGPQGDLSTKAVPLDPSTLGEVEVELTDLRVGLPVRDLKLSLGGFEAATGRNGVARGVVLSSGTYTLTLGENERYGEVTTEVTVTTGSVNNLTFDLEPIIKPTNR